MKQTASWLSGALPSLLLVMGLCGCASEQMYEKVQRDSLRQCEQLISDAAREDCMRNRDMTYEQYERERASLFEKTTPKDGG